MIDYILRFQTFGEVWCELHRKIIIAFGYAVTLSCLKLTFRGSVLFWKTVAKRFIEINTTCFPFQCNHKCNQLERAMAQDFETCASNMEMTKSVITITQRLDCRARGKQSHACNTY